LLKEYVIRHKSAIFSIAIPLFIFIELSEDYIRSEFSVFDLRVYTFLSGFMSESLTMTMKTITYFGSALILAILAVCLYFVFIRYEKYAVYARLIIINLAASSILNELFKVLFHRERPNVLRLVDVTGFSFPSGHSMTSLSFYGFLVYIFLKNVKSIYIRIMVAASLSILILLIGISRVYLGVHYASDVLAGFSEGLTWLAGFIVLSKRHFVHNEK
jgi:undecaprenyl-diphosphatase